METKVTEIAPHVYRLSTYLSEYRMAVNQFLINDDEPFLMHAGFKSMFSSTKGGVASILNNKQLRWVGFSHFESDECGALNQWLESYPEARAVCSTVGAMVNLGDFAIRPARGMAEGEVLETGRSRIRFLSTPHVPHAWDAGLFFEEHERVLLCSDLFFHPGDPEPITSSDIVGRARSSIVANLSGPLSHDMPYTPYTDRTFQRLADLKPKVLALMHGSAYAGDGELALREYAAVVRDLLGCADPA
jgi:flavorubredoxin